MDFNIETDRYGVAWINGVCITDLDGLEKVALLRAYAEATPDAAAGTWLLEYADLLERTGVAAEPPTDTTVDETTLYKIVARFATGGDLDDLAHAVKRLRAFLAGMGLCEAHIERAAALLVEQYLGGGR